MEKIIDFEVIEKIIKDSSIVDFKNNMFVLNINDNMSLIFDNVEKTERFIYFNLNHHLVFVYRIQ